MRYFELSEFDCPCCHTSHMDFDFVDILITARAYADVPFIITSGWRCKKHNKTVGGKPDSAHTIGKAVDLAAVDSRQRFWIIYGLINAGFTIIGIGKDFIHADTDNQKDKEVVWLY